MIMRRVIGLVLLCLGTGMFIVITMPAGMVVLAALLVFFGFYLATRRR